MGIVQKVRDLSRPVRRRMAAIYQTIYAPALPCLQCHGEQPRASVTAVSEALLVRWAQYRAASLDLTLSEHDDMFVAGQLEHYLFVGTSALEIISEAMLLARKTRVLRLLDVPCGYGRVTRHLVKFFPDSQIFVSEIDEAKQSFCSSTFGVQGIDLPPDFSGEPTQHFDLIFVGSLLTHLNASLSINALHYLLKALSEGGLLILTTHGRHATALAASRGRLKHNTLRSFLRRGFEYHGSSTYGSSRMAPSWVLRILESVPDARVVGHKEQGWALHQDVFVIEKATGWTWPRPF
jgi:SAM-dependent methyltransferase